MTGSPFLNLLHQRNFHYQEKTWKAKSYRLGILALHNYHAPWQNAQHQIFLCCWSQDIAVSAMTLQPCKR